MFTPMNFQHSLQKRDQKSYHFQIDLIDQMYNILGEVK